MKQYSFSQIVLWGKVFLVLNTISLALYTQGAQSQFVKSPVSSLELYSTFESIGVVAYLDTDESGSFNPIFDQPRFGACSDGKPVMAWYLPAPTDLDLALGMGRYELPPGWSGLAFDSGTDEWTLLNDVQLSQLVVSSVCTLGE